MAKLKLTPDPTFKAKVAVPIPGGTADVVFEFQYRDRKALTAWFDDNREASDVDTLMDVVVGWDLDDAFNRDNVERLCNAYPGAAREVLAQYARELSGIRQGN